MRALLLIALLASAAHAQPKRPPPKQRPIPVKESIVPPAPADPNEMSPADARIAMKFFDHFIDVVKGATDCESVAVRINFVIDRNRELVRLMAEATAKGQKMPKATQDAMSARVMKDLMPVLQNCMSNQNVMAALERFQPRKPPQPVQPQIN